MAHATAPAIQQDLATTTAERHRQAAQILRFTRVHQSLAEAHPAEREAAMLALQLEDWFRPLRAGDAFAGRFQPPLACFSPEPGGFGYGVQNQALDVLTKDEALGSRTRSGLLAARSYWATRSGHNRALAAIRDRAADGLGADPDLSTQPIRLAPLFRIAGLSPDLPRLMVQGLPGLRDAIRSRAEDAEADAETRSLCTAWLRCVALLDQVLADYAVQARALEQTAIAVACESLRRKPPQTLREGLQLALIVTSAAGILNFGRIDDAFGPLYAADLRAGRLDQAQGLELVLGWFRLIASRSTIFNGRVVVGGIGRRHPVEADAFARVALIAAHRQRDTEPQLSLRLGPDQDPELLELGLAALGDGCSYPILYHDAVNVPAVAHAFRVDLAVAASYVPYGCGEFTLGPSSLGTPNAVINLALILDDVLHGRAPGQDGRPPQWASIGGLWEDLQRALWLILRDGAHAQAASYQAIEADGRLLLPSLLVDGPLERGRALLDGGIRYRGGTMEVYGQTNAADAITAIDRLVYRERGLDLDRLRAALAADFAGADAAVGARLHRQPKYGNDHPEADRNLVLLHDQVCAITRNLAPTVGLHHWLVVVINNWANTLLGRHTPATADGRRAGEPLANANGPTSGQDREGPSALLASLAKPDPGIQAGMVQHLKLSGSWFASERRPVLLALLRQYFEAGGSQLMITVSQPGELQAAMERPQDYAHLLVRVGGFSARFVELPRDCQAEIAARTLH